jgi:hypothetical protein
VQDNILTGSSGPNLKVYAIWTDRLVTDARWRWDAAGLTDKRVEHLWDQDNLAGSWLAKNLGSNEVGDWDAYFLFGSQATWDKKPTELAGKGSTVLGEGRRLAEEITGLSSS